MKAPSTPLSIGVVGCGYWGPNLIRNFNNLPQARVAALCDMSADRLAHMRELYPEAAQFTDFEEMLAGISSDVVLKSTTDIMARSMSS